MADKTRSQFWVPIAITGTGALDIAAGVTADINANLTVSSAFDTKDPIKDDHRCGVPRVFKRTRDSVSGAGISLGYNGYNGEQ